MRERRIVLFCSMLSFIIAKETFAQCAMYALPLKQKVENASDIFEGKVKSKNCFWNAQRSLIFTSNIIEVYKIFKGNIVNTEVEIITEGGVIGDKMQSVEPNLNLTEGDIGIFMVEPTAITDPLNINTVKGYRCYGNAQGFFKYDPVTKTAATPFNNYIDIENDLYQSISKQIGKSVRVIKSVDLNQLGADVQNSIGKSGGSINAFNPITISAGTNSVLTIDGVGFGAIRGSSYVGFKNADDGGNTFKHPYSSQYILWSDTQIKVIVPSKAGTGIIQVVVGGVTILTSSATLIVSYAESNTSADTINQYQTSLINLNGSGGITWHMYTGFDSNTPAKNSFNRALQTWSANTHINWIVGSTTSVNTIGYDSVNVVRFDIGNELAAGTLARCYYYWSGCIPNGSTLPNWLVVELDMAIDDGVNWQLGPAAPTGSQYDLESVLLHELGHGHQLAHVLDNTDVMNYSSQSDVTKRTLNANNSAAGIDVMSRSIVAYDCGLGHGSMTVNIDEKNYLNNNELLIFPNPTSGNIIIEFSAEVTNTTIEIFDYLGERIIAMNQNNGSKKMNLDLSNLTNGVYCIVANVNGKILSKNIVLSK